MAVGGERFELLIEIGDVEFEKLNSRGRAGKTYLAALDERPDDRKLLTKLMELYSAEKDWGSLVEVVLRLVEFVDDPKQRAKYMHTAAMVTARHLGRDPRTRSSSTTRRIDFDPTLSKAMDEAIELRLQTGDHEGVERLLKVQLEQAKRLQDRDEDRRGARPARRALSQAPERAGARHRRLRGGAGVRPGGKGARGDARRALRERRRRSTSTRRCKAQTQMLRVNPYRVESYKLLRRLYTEARRPDPAWCLCQALSVLRLAEADEERFYLRYRGDNAAPAQAVLEEEDWVDAHRPRGRRPARDAHLRAHPADDHPRAHPAARGAGLQPRATAPIWRRSRTRRRRCCTTRRASSASRRRRCSRTRTTRPGLGFVHAQIPSIVLGRAAFERVVPDQSLAFVAGRHLTYFRPGYYVRHLVPTGTGLKAWLFAAIRLCVPQFPIGPDLQGQVNEALAFMTPDFIGRAARDPRQHGLEAPAVGRRDRPEEVGRRGRPRPPTAPGSCSRTTSGSPRRSCARPRTPRASRARTAARRSCSTASASRTSSCARSWASPSTPRS